MWEGLLMLLWQPQNSLKLRSVFIVSLVLHVLVCFALLFVYKDYHQRLVIDLSSRIPSNAIVKLLPLSASRPSSQVLGVKGGKKDGIQKSGKKSQVVISKQSSFAKATADKRKKSPTSLVKQIVTSKSAKAAKGKASSFAKAMADKEAAKKAKTLLQEKKKSSIAKAKEDKQIAADLQKKKEAEKLAQEKKAKEVVEKESKPVEQLIKEEVAESTQALIADQSQLGEASASTVGPEGQEILYLTKQEFDALQIQQKLQECLFDLWTPPAGIPPGALCEVLITVGWDGAILETQFLKKTEILMYDLSVQETLEQVTFPHEVWGKQITIAFKP